MLPRGGQDGRSLELPGGVTGSATHSPCQDQLPGWVVLVVVVTVRVARMSQIGGQSQTRRLGRVGRCCTLTSGASQGQSGWWVFRFARMSHGKCYALTLPGSVARVESTGGWSVQLELLG